MIRVLDGWQFPDHGDHAWSVHPEKLDSTVPCLVITGTPRELAEAAAQLSRRIIFHRDDDGRVVAVEVIQKAATDA